MEPNARTLVQCDFDGTVTDKDVSFLLLDAFADGDWRKLLRQYQAGEITVGQFNTTAFALIRQGKETLLNYLKGRIRVRGGFPELVAYCRRRGLRFVIVSNGQDFYIEKILSDLGLGDVEFFCARSRFEPQGIRVQYIGPDGLPVDSDFKETYVNLFLSQGYRIIYIGNGASDFAPAQRCHHIFATGDLLAYCQRQNLPCTPFTNFNEVIRGLAGNFVAV